jgi:hypothetical protein
LRGECLTLRYGAVPSRVRSPGAILERGTLQFSQLGQAAVSLIMQVSVVSSTTWAQ